MSWSRENPPSIFLSPRSLSHEFEGETHKSSANDRLPQKHMAIPDLYGGKYPAAETNFPLTCQPRHTSLFSSFSLARISLSGDNKCEAV